MTEDDDGDDGDELRSWINVSGLVVTSYTSLLAGFFSGNSRLVGFIWSLVNMMLKLCDQSQMSTIDIARSRGLVPGAATIEIRSGNDAVAYSQIWWIIFCKNIYLKVEGRALCSIPRPDETEFFCLLVKTSHSSDFHRHVTVLASH